MDREERGAEKKDNSKERERERKRQRDRYSSREIETEKDRVRDKQTDTEREKEQYITHRISQQIHSIVSTRENLSLGHKARQRGTGHVTLAKKSSGCLAHANIDQSSPAS